MTNTEKEKINRLLEKLRYPGICKAEAQENVWYVFDHVGFRMVGIPAGTFMMGSPPDDEDRAQNESRHEVTLTKDFHMMDTPVTRGLYAYIMEKDRMLSNPDYPSYPDYPIDMVSWDEAVEFCRRLSDRGEKFRLPTEAEWEYACRAGSAVDPHYSTLGDYAVFDEYVPYPTGSKKPNAFGLYDMLGNVAEWCSDWYQADLGNLPTIDPKGPETGSCKVQRGSPYGSLCRASYRHPCPPEKMNFLVGFRCVREF